MTADDIKSLMQEHVGIPPGELTAESLRQAGCLDRVAVLPEQFNDRVRYLGNLLVQMIGRATPDDHLRLRMGALCQAISYLLNSASWADGTLHDFDADELSRKLKRFIQ